MIPALDALSDLDAFIVHHKSRSGDSQGGTALGNRSVVTILLHYRHTLAMLAQ